MSAMTDNTLMLSTEDTKVIRAFKQQLDGSPANISSNTGHDAPVALVKVLNEVLQAVAEGRSISISQLPKQITTTTAASLLGVSRPTVMKYIRQGKLTASMAGSHHRLNTDEVLALQEKRKEELRTSVFEILDMED